MRAKKGPTAAELRLGPGGGDTPDECIMQAAGDPAYLHELGPCLDVWSRKQIEKAVSRLLNTGRLQSYGTGTRRLYSSPREVNGILQSMPAGHVRLLQYLPLAGGIEQDDLSRLKYGTGATVNDLVDLGLVVRVLGARNVLMLTAHGRRVRMPLGDGLAIAPVKHEQISLYPRWWTTLERLADKGSILIQGDAVNAGKLAKYGLARMVENHLLITESGRDAYHARIDLIDLTRMIETGVSAQDAHARLAEQHAATRREASIMPKTAKPIPANERNLHAYLLMRTDMPSLGIGKSRAQAMYAGNNMTHELYVKPLKAGRKPHRDVETWHDQGAGFGTAIAIGARNEITLEVLQATIAAAQQRGFMAGLLVDEHYPYSVSDEMLRRIDKTIHTREPQPYRQGWRCFCRETTAGWILGDKAELEDLLSRFNLTPHAERERERF